MKSLWKFGKGHPFYRKNKITRFRESSAVVAIPLELDNQPPQFRLLGRIWHQWVVVVWRRAVVAVMTLLLGFGACSGTGLSDELPPPAGGAIEGFSETPVEMLSEYQSPSRLTSSDISLEKVNQFVQAYLQVLQLIEQREGELQGAETEPEALQVEREIESEALLIIKLIGLTRQEYLQLLSLANVDPEFGERIATQLQEHT